jgi:hypothetical protein
MIGLAYCLTILGVKLYKWLQVTYVPLDQLVDIVDIHCILKVMHKIA